MIRMAADSVSKRMKSHSKIVDTIFIVEKGKSVPAGRTFFPGYCGVRNQIHTEAGTYGEAGLKYYQADFSRLVPVDTIRPDSSRPRPG